MTLFYYAGLDEGASGEFIPKISHVDPNHMTGLTGSTDGLGNFKMDFVDKGSHSQHFYAETDR